MYKFYGEELREMFGYEEHPYGFYTMAGNYTIICKKKFPPFSHYKKKSITIYILEGCYLSMDYH